MCHLLLWPPAAARFCLFTFSGITCYHFIRCDAFSVLVSSARWRDFRSYLRQGSVAGAYACVMVSSGGRRETRGRPGGGGEEDAAWLGREVYVGGGVL